MNGIKEMKAGLIGYLVVISGVAIASLWLNSPAPVWLAYLLIGALFIVPTTVVATQKVPVWLMALFSLITPALTMLVVIGPTEAGMFGHDPYIYSAAAYDRFINQPGSFFSRGGDFPALFSLVGVLSQLLGIEPLTVAKFTPLVAATIPLFFFVSLSQFITHEMAFYVAMGVSSVRTLLVFQTKFVEESLAMTLLFAIVASFLIINNRQKKLAIVSILAIGVGFSHHYTAALMVAIIALWALTPMVPFNRLSDRFRTIESDGRVEPMYFLLSAAVVVTIFFFAFTLFMEWSLTYFLQALFVSGTTSPTGGASGASLLDFSQLSLRRFLTRLSMVTLLVLALFTAAGTLSKKALFDWQQGWVMIAGVISILYVVTLVAGRVIPLDPIRFFTPLLPILFGVTVSIIALRQVSVPKVTPTALVLSLLALVLVTQLASIPPHLAQADQTDMVYGESHYTPSELAAAEWAATHGTQPILAQKLLLWHTTPYSGDVHTTDGPSVDCAGYEPIRDDYQGFKDNWERPAHHRVIWDAGGISIGGCWSGS